MGFGISAAAYAAGGDAGTNAADFLRLGGSARAVAQGEAFVGRGGVWEGLQYNPAGLARLDTAVAHFQHNQYLLDITSNQLSLALPATRYTLAAAVTTMDHGDFTRRTLTNPTGAGTFSASNLWGSLGVGYRATERVSLGVALKGFNERIDAAERAGVAVDLGLHYAGLGNRLELGAAVRNLGPRVKFDTRREELPFEYAGGFAFMMLPNRLRLSVEAAKPRNQEVDYRVGLDWRLAGNLYLRGGYNSRNDLGRQYTLGAGFKTAAWSLDYAFTPFGVAGDAHRFGLTYQFLSPLKRGLAPPLAISPSPPSSPSPYRGSLVLQNAYFDTRPVAAPAR